jgi:hypothetical protein
MISNTGTKAKCNLRMAYSHIHGLTALSDRLLVRAQHPCLKSLLRWPVLLGDYQLR